MDFLFSIGKCRLYILWEKKEVSENQDEMLVQTASRSVCACVSCYNATVNFLSSTSSLCWQALEERGWWLWGHGPGRLLSLRHKHSSESSWAECCKWHFFLRCLLQKKKKKKSPFQFLLWDWKHWWSLHSLFPSSFMRQRGNGGDGKERM